jgi:hypothetical protein
MKKLIFATSFILSFLGVNAQKTDSIFIGKKVTIYSKVLSENRKIWVYTPEITSLSTGDDKRYPVLYLLDGDAHFFSTVGIVQQLSHANGNGILPEMIVVAIENTNRLRDLTPASLTDGTLKKANPFLNFLSTELIPYVDKNFKTAPYKLLAGHSLGGLTAVDIMTNYLQAFNAYIAIDPSMWHSNEKFLNNTISQLPKKKLNGTKLFIGTANTMPEGMTIAKLKLDNSPETQHLRSIFKLAEFLKTNNNGLKYAQVLYDKEKHNTVPLISLYDGLRFVFDYYSFDASEKDFTDSSSLIAIRLKKHYANISREMGYRVSAPESFVNYLGYDALGKKHYDKAEALFKLNLEGYPSSSNVYDSYADFLIAKKDTANAITYYKKAIAIKNDPLTVGKLNALQKQESFILTPEELQKYQGVYTLEKYKIDITLQLTDGKLWAKVPGQSVEEFVPLSRDVFAVRGKQGYTITFKMNGNKPIEFTSVQPNGTFKALFKNE